VRLTTPRFSGRELSTAITILSARYRYLGSCSRAAGWSAATSSNGTFETCQRPLKWSAREGRPELISARSKTTRMTRCCFYELLRNESCRRQVEPLIFVAVIGRRIGGSPCLQRGRVARFSRGGTCCRLRGARCETSQCDRSEGDHE